MPEITEQELEEYNHLKSIYTRERIVESVNSIKKLEDDIDEPIKTVVMQLALLGCEPRFSCCGFDYTGQPLHKAHVYGHPYIDMHLNERSRWLVSSIAVATAPYINQWIIRTSMNDGEPTVSLYCNIERPPWDKHECIHYGELGATFTVYLEKYLQQRLEYMADSVTIKDTSSWYKELFPHWQYPPKEDWVITKEALMERIR